MVLKITDFNAETLWLIDTLEIGQTKDKIRCIFKYPIDGAFIVAILRDERDGEYFITSQKEPYLNGLILKLSDRQKEKIEALHEVVRTYREIEKKFEQYDEYEREIFDKYLKIEFNEKEFFRAVITYCQSIIKPPHPLPH